MQATELSKSKSCLEFSCSPCECLGSLQVLRFHPTVQKYKCQIDWSLWILFAIDCRPVHGVPRLLSIDCLRWAPHLSCVTHFAESGAFAAMHRYTVVIFAINHLAELFVFSLFATALFLTVVGDDMVVFQVLTRHVVCTSKWNVKIILD